MDIEKLRAIVSRPGPRPISDGSLVLDERLADWEQDAGQVLDELHLVLGIEFNDSDEES